MTQYAIIEKPYHPKRFTIHLIFHEDYLKAIAEFKNSDKYSPNKSYSIFNVDEEDNQYDFRYITDLY